MTRFAVVSSRIFDCPCSSNDMVGGIFRAVSRRANVVRGLVERVSRRHIRDQLTANCRSERWSMVGPRPRSIVRDVVDPDLPGRRRHGQPADLCDVAR